MNQIVCSKAVGSIYLEVFIKYGETEWALESEALNLNLGSVA
jgi:hypothetical protein